MATYNPAVFDLAAQAREERRNDTTLPSRAILYGRQSTSGKKDADGEEKQRHARESQERICRAWAEQRGATVECELFYDKASGGKRNRAALGDAIDYAKANKPKGWRKGQRAWLAVVTHKLDRLSRDAVALVQIEGEFARHGARVYYTNTSNALNDQARVQRAVLSFVAEVERIHGAARVRVMQSTLRANNKSRGNAPLGSRVAGDEDTAETGKLLTDEAESAVLDLLYAECRPGPHRAPDWKPTTSYALTKVLNSDLERWAPRGKRWYRASVHRILRRIESAGFPTLEDDGESYAEAAE